MGIPDRGQGENWQDPSCVMLSEPIASSFVSCWPTFLQKNSPNVVLFCLTNSSNFQRNQKNEVKAFFAKWPLSSYMTVSTCKESRPKNNGDRSYQRIDTSTRNVNTDGTAKNAEGRCGKSQEIRKQTTYHHSVCEEEDVTHNDHNAGTRSSTPWFTWHHAAVSSKQ